jgi:hypothetical protein
MNDIIEQAKSVLLSFMNEMNLWEVKYKKLYKEDDVKYMIPAREDLRNIYLKWLTNKERKTGRLAGPSVGYPPEYDTATEVIDTVEKISINKLVIYTDSEQIKGFNERFRYTLKRVNNEWRIGKKETFSDFKEKWVNLVF